MKSLFELLYRTIFKKKIIMAKYLITGGSGFIGTNLIDELLKRNEIILNIDIQKPKKEEHLCLYKKVDLLNEILLEEVISKFNPDYVIHLAARTDLNGNTIDDYSVNTIGTKNLINALKKISSVKKSDIYINNVSL
jgi:nucleoside-diphosphate-sugar epimerase